MLAEYEILKVLATNPPMNLYQLEKTANLKHATAHKALRKLLQTNLVQPISTKKFRTGLQTKTYTLTYRGLLAALSACGDLWRHIDKVAAVYSDALIIFRKWHLFTDLKQDIITSLQHALQKLDVIFNLLLDFDHDPFIFGPDDLAAAALGIDALSVDPQRRQPQINYEAIWQVCKKDADLKRFFEEQLELRLKAVLAEAAAFVKAKQIWNSLN